MDFFVECEISFDRAMPVSGAPQISEALFWSEVCSGDSGVTVNSAPFDDGVRDANAVFLIHTFARPAFISIGPNPNAATGNRRFLRGGESRRIVVRPGDKLAWMCV
ncbi:hypothetical protein [Xanthobacter autotrophicus]|uniref:hypothetical protein n=1 Tax=Xanthobacter autotrophicus TaxID=280 RepID=UPI0024A78525|nr:hypothetical protein [Xanthobacter autotrophicus]MDI4656019.1 hypothetical protein [Xanthobacter autotrophicus]